MTNSDFFNNLLAVIDLETTGFDVETARIVSIGIIGQVVKHNLSGDAKDLQNYCQAEKV